LLRRPFFFLFLSFSPGLQHGRSGLAFSSLSSPGAALKAVSLTSTAQLWERFRPGQTPPPELGASREYNVDMVPKFIMANGNLVKVGRLDGGTDRQQMASAGVAWWPSSS
jgi:GDP dissociation inhibitor